MQIQAVSRTRKWSCRVTAVAELLTGGGGGGGGEARPAALPGHSRGSTKASPRSHAGLSQPANLPPRAHHLPRRLPARLVPGGLVCTTHPTPGAAAPRGPVGVPGRARPLALSPAGTMMEEIDRFQVPTAHSEMQPLVRGRAAGRPGPGGGAARGGGRESGLGNCGGDALEWVKGSLEIASRGEGGLAEQENRGEIRGVTAKRPVKAQGTVSRDRPRELRGGPSDGTFGAQWCTLLVEALSWERKGTVMGHRRWQAQGAGMRGEEPLSPRGL